MTKLPSLSSEAWLNDPALRRIFAALAAAGGESRVAGGAVRNALLREPVNDIDIATTLPPERIIVAGEKARLGVHPTGIAHGTVTLVSGGKPFEVTTLRIDVETYGRKARVAFTDDWEADARRRDFTMNALYCSVDGGIYDPVQGYKDILGGKVRFVGEPAARIKEDYLRILRFFRFHARYGRGAPDRKGLAACITYKAKLKQLSSERIRQELFKLLEAKRASDTVKLMAARNVLKVLFAPAADLMPIVRMAKIDAAQGLAPDALLRLALIAKAPHSLRERLRLTNAEMKRLEVIGSHVTPHPSLRDKERRAVLYRVGAEAWRDMVRLAWAQSKQRLGDKAWRELLAFADQWTIPRFPLSGQDLLACGFKSGPELGQELIRLEDWWIASDFTESKVALLRRLETRA
ncbi:CCA tRNA nucleotidyltransferase [Nordella sp. HKS 07]|uniref:CCA tRNA nucleotidyltransferase n=1 Tax=Nordella sp. HKS 07 TaxID=2712222 RepID=UPI0013E1DA75|nr:CCA tRNA nucleotidyltransferase [Nordella sp. HKS 07]QIG46521.1 CCA tRNA nucleotidyltransferase [Nordella sp. HKS 07]